MPERDTVPFALRWTPCSYSGGQRTAFFDGRVLEYFHRHSDNPAIQTMPDPETFYERALAEGVVSEALSHAESFFAESARLAEPAFPSWVPFQKACVSQARRLREDYEKLVTGA